MKTKNKKLPRHYSSIYTDMFSKEDKYKCKYYDECSEYFNREVLDPVECQLRDKACEKCGMYKWFAGLTKLEEK